MIVLREGVRSDLRSLFDLDQVCFPPDIAYAIDEMRYFLSTPRTVKVVAEDDEQLAGFAIAEQMRERGRAAGHVITIDVAPGYRRRGVGRLLMGALEERLTKAGAELLKLEVAVDNSPAIAFYRRLGFEATGRLRAYYPSNVDALVMHKAMAEGLIPSS